LVPQARHNPGSRLLESGIESIIFDYDDGARPERRPSEQMESFE